MKCGSNHACQKNLGDGGSLGKTDLITFRETGYNSEWKMLCQHLRLLDFFLHQMLTAYCQSTFTVVLPSFSRVWRVPTFPSLSLSSLTVNSCDYFWNKAGLFSRKVSSQLVLLRWTLSPVCNLHWNGTTYLYEMPCNTCHVYCHFLVLLTASHQWQTAS